MTDEGRKSIFAGLTPEVIISSVEEALAIRMTGLTIPLPSYINRVYELQSAAGERLIAKFYRPARWSSDAIAEEHAFMADCAAAEIPVVAPLGLANASTIFKTADIYFSVFPKKSGREFEINTDEDWVRVGMLIGRIHSAGSSNKAVHRTQLLPGISTAADLEFLSGGGFIAREFRDEFKDVTSRITGVLEELFKGVALTRIHGDCHRGNLIERPGEGLMVIDFDDMMMGPAVHDLWLMLPDFAWRAQREINLILSGYEEFMDFDRGELKLIEGLRFMRMIYYLAWCARQTDDYDFMKNHPDWGSENFWSRELGDIKHQFQVIMEYKEYIDRQNIRQDDDDY